MTNRWMPRARYEWLGLGARAALIAHVKAQMDEGALDDDYRADELETSADDTYSEVLPTDETLVLALRKRLETDPSDFAAL